MIVTPTKLVFEFMAPYDKNITLLLIGDSISADTKEEFTTTLTELRNSAELNLNAPKVKSVKLKDLYRGKLENEYKKKSNIFYLDENVSHNVIKLIMQDTAYVDELDTMLLNKYLMSQPISKYLMDLSRTSDSDLYELMNIMDHNSMDFNYLVANDYLAIWMNFKKDLKLA